MGTGNVLSGHAHGIAVERVVEPIARHSVAEGDVAELLALAECRDVGGIGHRLLTARDHDGSAARLDLLVSEHHSAEARAADLVDQRCGRAIGKTSPACGLSRRVHALSANQHLTNDRFIHLACIYTGTVDRPANCNGAEFVTEERGEQAIEGADGSTRCGNDDGGRHG